MIAAGVWSTQIGGISPRGRASRSVRSRARSCACTIPPAPGCCRASCAVAGVYIAPRGDGRYVLGATMEERGFDTTVTAGRGVRAAARRDRAGAGRLGAGRSTSARPGCGPARPTTCPAIGPGAVDGLHWATGHRPRRRSCWRRSPPSWWSARWPASRRPSSPPPSRRPASPAAPVGSRDVIVTVNGEPRELQSGATVASVVELLDVGPGARGVAVALDGEVVSRGRVAADRAARGRAGRDRRRDWRRMTP